MTYLQQVDRGQQRRRGRVLIPVAIAMVLIVVSVGATWLVIRSTSGTDHGAAPALSPVQGTAVTAEPAPAASESPVVRYDDPDGYAACAEAKAWYTGGGGYDLEALRALGAHASRSAHGMIRGSGQLLVAQAKLADDAKGTSEESSMPLKMNGLAMDLYSTCVLYKYL